MAISSRPPRLPRLAREDHGGLRAIDRPLHAATATLLGAAAAALVVGDGGCVSRSSGQGAGEGDVATVQLAIKNVPSDILCLQITAAGSVVRTEAFSVAPGGSTTLTMRGVPPGSVKFSAAAFAAACGAVNSASIPTWIADPVTKTIVAGVQTNLTLVMRPAGNVGVMIDFQGGAGDGGIPLGVWDTSSWDFAVWQ